MFLNYKSFYSTRLSVFTTSFSFLFLLLDFKSIVSNISENLFVILISLAFFLILFVLYFLNKLKANKIVNENSVLFKNSKSLLLNKINFSKSFLLNFKNDKYFSIKLLFSFFIAFVFLVIVSLFSVRNMPIYYVVLKKNLSFNYANHFQKSINSKLESKKIYQLHCTVLRQSAKEDKFLLSINGGFLNKNKATFISNVLNELNYFNFHAYVSDPNYNTHFIRKLVYINNHFFEYFR